MIKNKTSLISALFIGILTLALTVPGSVQAASVYTWTDHTGPGAHIWTGVASSDDGVHLVAVAINRPDDLGDIYTSSDSGATWTDQTSAGSRDWAAVASSADGAKLSAVVFGGSIYTSTDYGATWNQTSAGSRDWLSIASSADGTKLIAGVTEGDIWTSPDSGVTWYDRSVAGSGYWLSITSSSDGVNLVAAAEDDNIYLSSDSGVSWNTISLASILNGNQPYAVTSSADGRIIYIANTDSFILASTDYGATWSSIIVPGAYEGVRSIATSDNGAIIIAPDHTGDIFTSIDYGATWVDETTTGVNYWPSVACSADCTKVIGGSGDGNEAEYLYTGVLTGPSALLTAPTTNAVVSGSSATFSAIAVDDVALSGVTFYVDGVKQGIQDTSSPYAITWDSTGVVDGTHVAVAVVEDTTGNYATSTEVSFTVANAPSSYTWTDQSSAGSRAWVNITSSSDGTKLAAVALDGNVYTSTDSGATWTANAISGASDLGGITSSSDGTFLVTAGDGGEPNYDNGHIYTSTDSGATWTDQSSAGSRAWVNITSSSDGTKLAAVALDGNVYTSTDSGATWTANAISGASDLGGITSSSDGTFLVTAGDGGEPNYDNGHIYTSTDSGATWTDQSSAGSRAWVNITSSSDGTKLAAVALDGNVYTSTDSGATWTANAISGASDLGGITSSSDGTFLVTAGDGGEPNYDNGHIYTSTDSGATWTTEVVAGAGAWHGIISSSDGMKLAAAQNGGDIYTALFTIPADTTPPTTSVASLTPGSTVSGSSVTLSATASDNTALAGVSFYVDGIQQGSQDTTSPYSIVWDSTSVANGTHSTFVVAEDTSGNYATSTSVSFVVNNALSGGGSSSSSSVGSILSGYTNPNPLPWDLGTTTVQPTTPGSITGSYQFTRDLKKGMADTDVLRLQQYLNQHGISVARTGPGSAGNETSFFGALTFKAVIEFQNLYRQEVLTPVGLTQGTGYFGPSTRAYINTTSN